MKEKLMKNSTTPSDQHFEEDMSNLPVNGLKYGGDFSNAERLKESVSKQVEYVKQHQMKY